MFPDILNWIETHQLPCPVKYLANIDCPGCGLQRSFAALLRGDVLLSLRLHPATIPLILFVVFAALQLHFKFKKGGQVIIYSYIFIAIITLSHYILKIGYQNTN